MYSLVCQASKCGRCSLFPSLSQDTPKADDILKLASNWIKVVLFFFVSFRLYLDRFIHRPQTTRARYKPSPRALYFLTGGTLFFFLPFSFFSHSYQSFFNFPRARYIFEQGGPCSFFRVRARYKPGYSVIDLCIELSSLEGCQTPIYLDTFTWNKLWNSQFLPKSDLRLQST